MRKLGVFALGFLPLLACTAILGDFTIGGGPVDGGGDVDQGDVITTTDGGDSSTNLKPLKCGDNVSQRRQLSFTNSLNVDRIAIGLLPNGMVRVVAVDYSGNDGGGQQTATLRAYTYDPNQGGSPVDEADTTILGRVLDLTRYRGVTAGFAVLGFDYNTNSMTVTQMPNASTTWATTTTVTAPLSSNNSIDGALRVMDPVGGLYYIAATVFDNANNVLMLGAQVKNPSSTLTQLASFPLVNGRSPWGLVRPGIVPTGSATFIAFNPNGNNGPPPVDSPMMILPDPPGQPHMIAPPAGLNIFPAGLEPATDPLKTNAAFLIADLFFNKPPAYNVGEVQTSVLPNIGPGTLPVTPITAHDGGSPSLFDLFVDQSSMHWEVANGADQLLAVSPSADPVQQTLAGGVNFAWWDATTGINRAYLTGPGGKLLGDVLFPTGADVTINTLAGNIATLLLAYKDAKSAQQGGGLPPPCNLWVASIGCSP